MADFLARFDWSKTALLAHHAQFDGLILSHHYGITPAFNFCTMSMARVLHPTSSVSLENLAALYGLGEKTVPYEKMRGLKLKDMSRGLLEEAGEGGRHDCALTLELFERMTPHFPEGELGIIDLTVAMFTNPRFIGNAAGFRNLVQTEQDEKAKLLADVGVTVEELRSPIQFRALLEAQGEQIEMKQGKNGCQFASNLDPTFASNSDPS